MSKKPKQKPKEKHPELENEEHYLRSIHGRVWAMQEAVSDVGYEVSCLNEAESEKMDLLKKWNRYAAVFIWSWLTLVGVVAATIIYDTVRGFIG